jgi:predicted phosphoadenosine phosphosulfate sulfurtransferase
MTKKVGKTYIGIDVVEAARRRVSFLFDRFSTIVSCVSGGKDGHVLFELAYAEAIKRGRPLHVAFLDQELELESTIDVIRENMGRPGVVPLWYQVPVQDEYFISMERGLFHAWEPGVQWMRPKETIAITESPEGFPCGPLYKTGVIETDTWTRWRDWHSNTMGDDAAILVGDRADETNTRYFLVTRPGVMPEVRWSKKFTAGASTFYPVYDWSVEDVWGFIAREGIAYNRFYDHYDRIGWPVAKQRAGYLMSRNSYKRLADVEDFEPETYERLVDRTGGLARVAAAYGREGSMFFAARDIPNGFQSWRSYRDFLLSEASPESRAVFIPRFAKCKDADEVHRRQVRQLLSNDIEGFHSLADPKAGKVPPIVSAKSRMECVL